jgi:molecular chaperone Hsp33
MAAAAVLMQSGIKFDGALVMQVFGDGPVKLAVAEVQSDLRLRATASVTGAVPPGAMLAELVNAHGQGRCAITLDPRRACPASSPIRAWCRWPARAAWRCGRGRGDRAVHAPVGATGHHPGAGRRQRAAGLLLQRLPVQGQHNLAQSHVAREEGAAATTPSSASLLARSLKRDELLGLDADTVLRRLFWQEPCSASSPARAPAARALPARAAASAWAPC